VAFDTAARQESGVGQLTIKEERQTIRNEVGDRAEPIELTPVAERDKLLRELVETTSYVDKDGNPAYAPGDLPEVHDPEADADSEDTPE